MDVRIKPFKAEGEILVQPSKSDAHRKILCAAFSKGISVVDNIVFSSDIEATVKAIRKLGIGVEVNNSSKYKGRKRLSAGGFKSVSGDMIEIDCNESGSTLRFLSMILPAIGVEGILTGKGRLPERPMEQALEFYDNYGISYEIQGDGFLPIVISGKLEGSDFKVDSSVSSQFISGLMIGISAASMNAVLEATGKFESRGYAALTVKVLKDFGINIKGTNPYDIQAGEGLAPGIHMVEGDWSNASYFIAMNHMGGNVVIKGLSDDSRQPDRAIFEYLGNIGGEIDVSESPDIMPTIAAAAAARPVITTITGKRLRYKESDRIKTVCRGLKNMGIDVKELDDGIRITGKEDIEGGIVDSCNDHRIAMAFSTFACVSKGDIIIRGAESTGKSYPDFFSDLAKIGGDINEFIR